MQQHKNSRGQRGPANSAGIKVQMESALLKIGIQAASQGSRQGEGRAAQPHAHAVPQPAPQIQPQGTTKQQQQQLAVSHRSAASLVGIDGLR